MPETQKGANIYAEKPPLPEALVWTQKQLEEEKENDRVYARFIQRGFSHEQAMNAINDAKKNQAFLEQELQHERQNAGLDTNTIVENPEKTIPNRVFPTIEELRHPMDEQTIRERTEYAPIEDLIYLTKSAFEENNRFYRRYKQKWNTSDPLVRNWKLLRKEVIRRETEKAMQEKIAEPIDDNADTPVTEPPDMPETRAPQGQTEIPHILESSLPSGTDAENIFEDVSAANIPAPTPEPHADTPLRTVSETKTASDETPYHFDFAEPGDTEAGELQDALNEEIQKILGRPARPKERIETPLYGTPAVQRDVPVSVVEVPKKTTSVASETEKNPDAEMTDGGTIVYLDKKDPRAQALRRKIHEETKNRYQTRSDTLTKINKFEAINNMLNDQDELLRDLKKHGGILTAAARREKQTQAEHDERTVAILLKSLPKEHPITRMLEEKQALLAAKRTLLFPGIIGRIAQWFRNENPVPLSKIDVLNKDIRGAVARMKRSLEEPQMGQTPYPAPQKRVA